MPTEDASPVGSSASGQSRILIVIPTLGLRVDYLRQTIASVSGQSVPADVVVVLPRAAEEARLIAESAGAAIVDDPGGQSAAINLGMTLAEARHEFVNWLGDDDTLTQDSLAVVSAALEARAEAVVAFGHCVYVDEHDTPLWTNKAGRFAPSVLAWGPNLIPQPGMLMRRTTWEALGGLDTSLQYSMDLDLLLRARQMGAFVSVAQPVATFRWHTQSITVSQRTDSLAEAENVKRRYLPDAVRPLAPIWERPVRWATRRAAGRVTSRAEGIRSSTHSR